MRKSAVILILVSVLSVSLLTSCLSTSQLAEQALTEGSYMQAVELSLQALQEDPADAQALQTLVDSWDQANHQWEGEISRFLAMEDPAGQEQALAVYDRLIHIHTLVEQAGGWNLKPDPASLRNEAEELSIQIARLYFNQGSALYYQDTVETSRQAVHLIEKAFSLDPALENEFTYLYNLALEKATVRVFVFTGPDTNFQLNGIRMVPHIEDELDKLPFVEAVRVPSRYAASVDNDYGAKDFARGHRAEMMLHLEPSTTYAAQRIEDREPLSTVPWTKETTYLQATGTSEVRIVLIDLSDDSFISDSTITVERYMDSDIRLTGIQGARQETMQLGDMASARQLVVQTVPAGMNHITLENNLTNTEGIDLPEWGFQTGAEPLVSSPLDLNTYETLEELESFSRISDHTFLLFDVLEYNPDSDGNLSYQYAYGSSFGEGTPGRLATSAYERELYGQLKAKLTSRHMLTEFEERFLTIFYERCIGDDVVEAAADLF